MSTRSDVLRELLRTPAVRELLRDRLREGEPSGIADVLWEDPDLTLGAVAATPAQVNRLAGASLDIAQRLDAMPDPVLREFVTELVADVDGAQLAEALTVYGRLIRRVGTDDLPAALQQRLDEVDFGRVRASVEEAADGAGETLGELAAHLAADPVALSNLLCVIPPVLNALLRIAGSALAAAEVPREIKASALFSLIDGVDPRYLGATLDGVASTIVEIHEGSQILGKDEPRFVDVVDRLCQGLLDHSDPEQLARAVVALAEDVETTLGVWGDLLQRDPHLAAIVLSAHAAVVHAVMRGAAQALERAGELPDETIDAMADVIERQMEPRSGGRLVNATTALGARILQRRPELATRFGRELADSTDGVGALRLIWAVAEPAILSLDAEQLERSVERALLRGLSIARERPDLLRAVVRPVVKVARGALRERMDERGGGRALSRVLRRRR